MMTRPDDLTAKSAAAMAYWMKGSIFLTSFFSTQSKGSKPLSSAAIFVENWAVSNLVIRPTPVLPCMSESQVGSVPMPTGVTKPIPVTTTLRFTMTPPQK